MSSQVCPHCNNIGFEEQDGILYCTNCSRQLEGGFQLVADDPEFGTQGKVTRQKVTRNKVKVTQIYRGKRAVRLFLHAWQHILWKQCHALISSGAPEQLWTVARDLWGLRLAGLVGCLDDESDVSSALPKLYDTVALVYLAALIVRYPLPMGRLFQLVIREEVCFIRAVHHVPYDISSHLPPEYHEALDTTAVPTSRELQKHVTGYVLKTTKEYGMSVPALNWRILLFDWVEELALPIEVIPAAQTLAAFLQFDFTYRLSEKRRSPVANPETQLACLVVIAAKYLFPVSGPSSADTNGLHIDWDAWMDAHRSHDDEQQRKPSLKPGEHVRLSADRITTASPEVLDDYMDWYEKTFVSSEQAIEHKKSELEQKILDMFPLIARSSNAEANGSDSSDEQDTLVHRVQKNAMAASSHKMSGKDVNEAQDEAPGYLIIPEVQILHDLSVNQSRSPMLYLHERIADLACLNLKQIVKAVRHAERKIEKWVAQQKRDEVLANHLED